MTDRQYIAIDLKSFYASVECVERGLDPLTTNLVVADPNRTEKTICLAVSPSLKSHGIPGRARLFEVIQKVKEVNAVRKRKAPDKKFTEKSFDAAELSSNPSLELDFITAPPQMAHYMKISTEIYKTYLKYISPEDIHVYSIDEVFIDVTNYLKTYQTSAHSLAMMLIREVLKETGITATAGIGTNLYLCKIAMDIVAKHIPPDKDGVRIAELDEMSYREQLWSHRPITDFWRVGRGYSKRLEANGIHTMGDIARMSIYNEDILYKEFGVNAELLIDHAWGWEPCTIKDIKEYRPENHSISAGQVLSCPYNFEKARLVVQEMTELLALELVEKRIVTDQMVLTLGYDSENMKRKNYSGQIETDRYGRKIPKQAHGSENIGKFTSSSKLISEAVMRLFDRIADKELLYRRMYIVANHITDENDSSRKTEQLNLFMDFDSFEEHSEKEKEELKKERSIQETVIELHKKYGKNSVLKGLNLKEGATAIERNGTIGGHKA